MVPHLLWLGLQKIFIIKTVNALNVAVLKTEQVFIKYFMTKLESVTAVCISCQVHLNYKTKLSNGKVKSPDAVNSLVQPYSLYRVFSTFHFHEQME